MGGITTRCLSMIDPICTGLNNFFCIALTLLLPTSQKILQLRIVHRFLAVKAFLRYASLEQR